MIEDDVIALRAVWRLGERGNIQTIRDKIWHESRRRMKFSTLKVGLMRLEYLGLIERGERKTASSQVWRRKVNFHATAKGCELAIGSMSRQRQTTKPKIRKAN